MRSIKLRTVTAIGIAIILLVASISFVFAYLNMANLRLYPVNITATNISFKFNDKTYLDEIRSEDLSLYKGEPKDITMTVRVTGSRAIVVDYSVEFSYTAESPIIEAIEVYRYNGSRYEFLCMLDKLDEVKLEGFMVSDFDHNIDLRLVYSPASGAYYDSLANSGEQFAIKAAANASISGRTDDYVFVGDMLELQAEFTSPDNIGKTVVLKNNLTVTSNLTSAGNMGLELNGYTLTLEGNLTIDCQLDTSKHLGVTNRAVTGGITTTSGKFITVLNVNYCYLLSNSLNDGIVRINPPVGDHSMMFDDFISLIRTRTERFNDASLYRDGEDVSFLFDDVRIYLDKFALQIPAESAVQTTDGTAYFVDMQNEMTAKFLYAMVFTYQNLDLVIDKNATVSGYITVRGNSPKAIADALIAELPLMITGSQYLKQYDSYTGSYIDWFIEDGCDGLLFDANGRYRSEGIDALLPKLINYNDKVIEIYIKVSKGAETGNELTGDTYLYYTRNVETVSAAERTALIFDNLPLTLEKPDVYNIFSEYLIDSHLAKVNLTGIRVEILNDEKSYLEVVELPAAPGFAVVKVKSDAIVPPNTLTDVKIKIEFVYGSDESVKTYSLLKDFLVVGEMAEITKYDVSYRLQSAFNENLYISGQGYFFYAYGALLPYTNGTPTPVMVDYTVQGAAAEYISVTYEYVPAVFSLLDDQVAYFIYSEGKYIFAEDTNDSSVTYYERKANIEVLPARINTEYETVARITATLYTLDANGEPHKNGDGQLIYKHPISGRIQILTYDLTLEIVGIIHNNASGIPDTELYYVFRKLFDKDGDGMISTREARDWEHAVATGLPLGLTVAYGSKYSGTVHYIKLAGIKIADIKGIEFFPRVQGYDFTNTGRADLSRLTNLSNLVYLNFSTESNVNAVTNLYPLAYLDRLEYLNLNDNVVTEVEPLRYLPRLSYLYLNNNNVTNYEPLTENRTLNMLSINGMETASGQNFTNDALTMFDFALITLNNPVGFSFSYSPAITFTAEMKVATMVMRDLEEINRVTNTLYLPTYYYYDNGGTVNKYTLFWYTDANEPNLKLSESDSQVQGILDYTIETPIYDKLVKLYLRVYTGVGTGAYNISRDFNLTLETTMKGGLYIYDTSDGKYYDATERVPDSKLRNLLFERFNVDTSMTSITITVDGQSVTSTEKQVISKADFAALAMNKESVYSFTNKEISDLTGIEFLETIFVNNVTLILSGNLFTDLSPLRNLPLLQTLTLGGSAYDFTELIGLNNLTTLNVYECLDLDTEKKLEGLYELYTSKANLNIYLKSGVVWNPYLTLMPKKVSILPTTVTFWTINDTHDLYQGNKCFTITLYGVDYSFLVQAATIYTKYTTSTNYFSITLGTTAANYGGLISYNLMLSTEDSSYISITLRSIESDGRGRIDYSPYYVQLTVSDASRKIHVHNVSTSPFDDGSSIMPLGDLVGSRDLLTSAMTRIYTYIKSNPTRSLASKDAILTTEYSGNKVGFYYDAATDIYHITTDMLTKGGAMSTGVGSVAFSGSVFTLHHYGTYQSGDYALKGLRYFKDITTLTIYQDGNLQDGRDLVNLTVLNMQQSAVDFTTITIGLPLLKTIAITSCYTFKAGTAADSSFQFFPNLTTFSIARQTSTEYVVTAMNYVNDLSFLEGLIVNGKSSLTSLTAYSISSGTVVSSANATSVGRVYMAAAANSITAQSYRIGSPTSTTVSLYFRVIGDELWYCTTNSDSTASEAWASSATKTNSATSLEEYNNVVASMRDMGLRIQTGAVKNYWLTNKRYDVTLSESLILPGETGETYYGLVFGEGNEMVCSYDIQWTVFFTNTAGTETVQRFTGGAGATLNMSSYGNGFLVLFGTTTNVPTGGTSYTFMYHFIVGAGDGYYSAVNDFTLRAWLFAREKNATPVTNTISITGSSGSSYYYSILNSDILALVGSPIGGTGGYPKGSVLSNDNTTNYIYDLTGIDKVVTLWGMQRTTTGVGTITSITIRSQKFSSIEPLYAFSNLTSLVLYGAVSYVARYGYVKLTGIEGKLLNLTTLNLCYNFSIEPTDIELLLRDYRPLTSLSLYYTNCMYNRNVIEYLVQYFAANSANYPDTKAFSLSLNSSATATSMTVKQYKEFLTTIDPDVRYPNGISADDYIYENESEGKMLNSSASVNYTFSMTTYVNRLIKRYEVHTSVPIKLKVVSTQYPQLSQVWIDTVFKRNDVPEPMQFGSNGLTIEHFDTELIAYLLCPNTTITTRNMVKKADGYWYLSTSSTISANLGIESITQKNGATLTNGSYTVQWTASISTSIQNIAMGYRELNWTNPYTQSKGTEAFIVPNSNHIQIYYMGNSTAAYSYYYTTSAQATHKWLMPTHIYYLGNLYPITYTIPSANINANLTLAADASSPTGYKLITKTDQGWVIELSANTVSRTNSATNLETTVNSFRINYTVTESTATPVTPLSSYRTVNIYKYDDNTASIGYDFYVQVDVEGTEVYLQKANGDKYYSLGDTSYQVLYLYGGRYYTTQVNVSATPVYVVSANKIFESGRLVQYLFARYFSATANIVLGAIDGNQMGYIMTKANIQGRTEIVLQYSTSTSYLSYTQFITSIKGVEIFYAVTDFRGRGGAFIDISPLAGLTLTTFEYTNGNVTNTTITYQGHNYTITDFTPLLQGSKGSLTRFVYNAQAVSQLVDMSFLLEFTNPLLEIYIGSHSDTSYGPASGYMNGLAYFAMPAGKYLISALYQKNIFIYASVTMLNKYSLPYDTTNTKIVANYSNITVYALQPPIDHLLVYETLKQYTPDSTDVALVDNYKLSVKSSATLVGNKVSFELISTVVNNGGMYFVEWTKATPNVTINKYSLESALTITTEEGTKDFTADTALSLADAALIASSIEYFEAYKSGLNRLTASVSIDLINVSDLQRCINTRVVARMYYNECAYERTLTFVFNQM